MAREIRSAGRSGLMLGTRLLAMAALPAMIVEPAMAMMQDSARPRFDIPAQSLAGALTSFGLQSGLQVSVDQALLAGRNSAGVRGEMSAADALGRLLANTGLSWRMVDRASVVVEAAPRSAENAVQLGTLRVEGGGSAGSGAGGGEDGDAIDAANAPFRTPGSSAHIAREQIERVLPNTAGDLFRETPGVFSASNYNGTAIDVNIRGMQGMNRVKVLVDGTEQQSSTYRGYAGPDNRSYIDPELIGGIDIEKGPGAGSRGAGAIGGVVEIRTLEAKDLLEPGETFGGRLRGTIGDNRVKPRTHIGILPADQVDLKSGGNGFGSDNWLGSAAAAFRNDRFEIVGAYSHRQQGNYFAGEKHGDLTYTYPMFQINWWDHPVVDYSRFDPGSEVANTSENTESALLKAKVKWDDDMSLELGAVHYESEYGVVFPSRINFYAPQQYLLSKVESQRYYSRFRWNPADSDLISLSAGLWYTDIHSIDNSEDPRYFLNVIDAQAWGANFTNSSYASSPAGELKLTYGAEYSEHKMDRTIPHDPSYITDTEGTRKIGGLFANANLRPASWLMIDAGLRYDWFNTRGSSASAFYIYEPVFRVEYRPVEGQLSSSSVSPSGAITLIPWDGVQVFAKYARGWRPPSQIETFGSGTIGLAPNPLLRPEKSDSWEFGANFLRNGIARGDDVLRGKIAWFDNDYSDYIMRDISGQFFTNIQGAKMSGLEASFGYESGPFFASGHVTAYDKLLYCFEPYPLYREYPEFGFPAGKSCFNETPVNDWRGINVPPRHAGSATLGARLFDRRLTIGARTNFFGNRATRIPLHNGFNAPTNWFPTQTYDLFGGYSFTDAMKLDVSIENLTDRFYLAPMAVARMPSPGRMTKLTFTVDF